MARFPKSEAEIATLGRDLVSGLRTHTDDYPNPPVPPDELQATLQVYLDAREAAGSATGAATEAIAVKQEDETQPHEVEGAPREGHGWILLEWREPVDGGTASAYRVQRRLHEDHEWEEAGMSIDTQTLVRGQKRGVSWYYQVIAVNKAGEGEPSNSVNAVL